SLLLQIVVEKLFATEPFDIGFIDTVGVIRRSQVRAIPFLQFRSIALDPSIDCRMIDREVALLHHFFEVAITDGIAQIPANAQENNLGLIVTPLEETGFGHRQTSKQDSGSGQSTIIDQSHLFFATQPVEDVSKSYVRISP